MKSLMKTICLCGMILCAGFAILEMMENGYQQAWGWIAGLCLFWIGFSLFNKGVLKKKAKQTLPPSLLDKEQIQCLLQGRLQPLYPAGIQVKKNERIYWYDHAAIHVYQGKEGIMYFSNQRIFFYGKDFSFSHPLDQVSIQFFPADFIIQVNGRKLRFITSSQEALQAAWNSLHKK